MTDEQKPDARAEREEAAEKFMRQLEDEVALAAAAHGISVNIDIDSRGSNPRFTVTPLLNHSGEPGVKTSRRFP